MSYRTCLLRHFRLRVASPPYMLQLRFTPCKRTSYVNDHNDSTNSDNKWDFCISCAYPKERNNLLLWYACAKTSSNTFTESIIYNRSVHGSFSDIRLQISQPFPLQRRLQLLSKILHNYWLLSKRPTSWVKTRAIKRRPFAMARVDWSIPKCNGLRTASAMKCNSRTWKRC